MKKISSILFVLCCIFASAQIQQVPPLTAFNIPAQNSEYINKSKWKETRFNSANYTIHGYIYKKELLPGQNILIISDVDNDTILCGRYYTDMSKSFVDGFWKNKVDNNTSKTFGIFNISNTPDGLLTLNSKKGGQLNIDTKDLYHYEGFLSGNTAMLSKKDSNVYLLTIYYKPSDSQISARFVEVEIPRDVVVNNDFFNLRKMLQGNLQGKREWNNGTSFNGDFETIYVNQDTTNFFPRCGTFAFPEGSVATKSLVKLNNESYQFDKTLRDNIWREVTVTIPNTIINKYGFWSVDSIYMKNGSEIKIVYHNGDTFSGNYTCFYSDAPNSNEYQEHVQLGQGIFTYNTGECFEGDISKGWYCGLPTGGVMVFKDSSYETGDWLHQLNLNNRDIENITLASSPTEKRDVAYACHKKNQYKKLMRYGSQSMQSRRYNNALNYFNEALQNTDDYDERKETQKQIRLAELSIKYGDYAQALVEGRPEIGMTKAMLSDMPEGWSWSSKSKRRTANGEVEIWSGGFAMANLFGALLGANRTITVTIQNGVVIAVDDDSISIF